MRVASFTPDGRSVIGLLLKDDWSLWTWPADGRGPPQKLPFNATTMSEPEFSPDGRLLAYSSSESGRNEVYVQARDGRGVVAVSVAGGRMPHWSLDGSELYFREADALLAVRVSSKPGGGPPSVGRAEKVAELADGIVDYEPSPKRREFVGLQRAPGSGNAREIHLVLGFLEELQRLDSKR